MTHQQAYSDRPTLNFVPIHYWGFGWLNKSPFSTLDSHPNDEGLLTAHFLTINLHAGLGNDSLSPCLCLLVNPSRAGCVPETKRLYMLVGISLYSQGCPSRGSEPACFRKWL